VSPWAATVPGVVEAYTWDSLRQATLARQFPRPRGRGMEAIVELIGRLGPIQSQVARSPFVTVASRLPEAKYADIVAAYERFDLVRGSNLRGTVHTCVRTQHPLLDTITRRTLANLWRRGLKLERVAVGDVQAAIADFATGRWRTPDELRTHLTAWLTRHEADAAVEASMVDGQGRAMAHVHSALIRRPLGDGRWERQAPPGYRVAADVLGEAPSPWLDDPDAALVELTRIHLGAFGPANRRDVAWWSGEGLRNVDRALAALGDALTSRPGPDGQPYYDLVEASTRRRAFDPGVRLVPEYDALVVGYDPKTRDRFLDRAHLPSIWLTENGSFSPAVLVDGRLAASWRLTGSGRDRVLEIAMFPGKGALTESEVAGQATALQAALDIAITDVAITPAPA
jgi:hypothetical protein